MQLLPANALSSGGLWWQGETDLAQAPPATLAALRGRQMGMIFQEPLSSLNPVLTCGQQVAEVLRQHLLLSAKEAEARTKAWFEKVKLLDPARIYRSYPHQLSGGQRQRVMIAMALCAEPQLLIADEPTTALDVTVQHVILELIRDLQQEMGIAIIFISHDLAVIRSIAERVIVMQQGKCVEAGRVATVFAAPQHPYTKGLLACRPDLSRRLKRLATVSDFLAHPAQDTGQMLDKLAETAADMAQRKRVLAEAKTLLNVEKLQVWYPGQTNWLGRVKNWVKAVEEVSFSLKAGERLGIVGESGSGKTTLGKAILRLVDLHGGRISFAGQEVSALAGAELRALRPRMQLVFQDPFSSLNPKLTIGQMLLEPLKVHRPELSIHEQNERVRQVLAQVGLAADTLPRYAREFSGGQRQRIGLARALLLQPELLICDESVSALDVSVQAQVLNLIKDLQEAYQFSLIFISHDLSVIKFIADRVLVMKEGRVVEAGDTEVIFSSPQEAYTQNLLAAIP